MASVHIDNLDIVLGGNTILKGMNLEIADGEFLVLLGPSGCGKSTLLHTIAGFNDVGHGAIRIGERDVTWADPKDREIGMVFQSYALYPTMNVERNMSFGLRVAGVPAAEIDQRVAKAADMLQLTPLLKRRPAQLSGGQRQRVAIGRAVVRDARVYLFDEPLSNLDAKLRAELRRELKQLHHRLGATMIYVTHDQVEAMTLADRIAVMKAGVIQQIGSPDTIYRRPANLFVAGFLGSPGMNFVKGTLAVQDGRVHFNSAALQFDVSDYPFALAATAGQAVVLGVRPEHLFVLPAGQADQTGEGQQPAARRAGTATVVLTEPLGALSILWIDCGGQRMAVQVAAEVEPALGSTLDLLVDTTRISLFDAASEQRL